MRPTDSPGDKGAVPPDEMTVERGLPAGSCNGRGGEALFTVET
jgi:hypothetical protein